MSWGRKDELRLKKYFSQRNVLLSRLKQSEANDHGFVNVDGDRSGMNERIELLNTKIDLCLMEKWDKNAVKIKIKKTCLL